MRKSYSPEGESHTVLQQPWTCPRKAGHAKVAQQLAYTEVVNKHRYAGLLPNTISAQRPQPTSCGFRGVVVSV